VAFSGLALITTCAYASAEHREDLLSQVFIYGQNRLSNDEQKAMKLIRSSDAGSLGTNAYLAKAILQNAYAREQKSLQSCELLSGSIEKSSSRYVQLIGQREGVSKKNLSEMISFRASELRQTLPKEPKVEADESKYVLLVPERVKGKELFNYYDARSEAEKNGISVSELEKEVTDWLNELREQEIGELRIYDFYNAIMSYADGKRTIVDIRNAVFSEYDALFTLSSIERLFRVFESAHAVSIKQSER
jgi:hypothetical protein